MKGFILYRISTYLLLFVAAFFAMSVLLYLPMAFANPSLLLVIFLFVCNIVYAYTSYRFMSKGMIGQMTFKKSFRDLIKVNGYGSIVMGVLILTNCIYIVNNPALIEEQVHLMLEMNNMEIDSEVLISIMNKLFIILGIYASILIIHIFVTFKLLKKYSYLFDEHI